MITQRGEAGIKIMDASSEASQSDIPKGRAMKRLCLFRLGDRDSNPSLLIQSQLSYH